MSDLVIGDAIVGLASIESRRICPDVGFVVGNRRAINVSQVFAGQRVSVKQVGEPVWLVTFMVASPT